MQMNFAADYGLTRASMRSLDQWRNSTSAASEPQAPQPQQQEERAAMNPDGMGTMLDIRA